MKRQRGGRFVATGVLLQVVIMVAYRIRDLQFIAGPPMAQVGSMGHRGHAEQGIVQAQTSAMDPMVQSRLEDRCRLEFHRESRRLPAYALTVAKGEPKIKLAEDRQHAPSSKNGTRNFRVKRLGPRDLRPAVISENRRDGD